MLPRSDFSSRIESKWTPGGQRTGYNCTQWKHSFWSQTASYILRLFTFVQAVSCLGDASTERSAVHTPRSIKTSSENKPALSIYLRTLMSPMFVSRYLTIHFDTTQDAKTEMNMLNTSNPTWMGDNLLFNTWDLNESWIPTVGACRHVWVLHQKGWSPCQASGGRDTAL